MKKINLSRALLAPFTIEEDLDFNDEVKPNHPSLKDVKSGKLKATFSLEEGVIRGDINLLVDVTLLSDITLKEVDQTLDINETIYFTNDKNYLDLDLDIFYVNNLHIDLMPYLMGLIVLNLPRKIEADEHERDAYKDILISEDEYHEFKKKHRINLPPIDVDED
jgi:uncharacterized metal-binding protein YceD (DUF177 family)